jgi:hypothetical protein
MVSLCVVLVHLGLGAGVVMPQTVAVDLKTGDAWEATWGYGLVRRTGGREDRFTQFNSGLAGDIVFAVAFVDGRVWAATNGGVCVLDPVSDAWSIPLARRGDQPENTVINPESSAWATFPKALREAMRAQLRCEAPRTAKVSVPPKDESVSGANELPAIAVLGPRSRLIALPGDRVPPLYDRHRPDLLAIQLTVERANAGGGYRGQGAFELVTAPIGYGRYGWGLPEDDFIAFAADPRVVGVLAGLGPEHAILDAVVRCSSLAVVTTASPPGPLAEAPADNPWVFRCWGEQPRQHRMLLDHVLDRRGCTRPAMVRTPTTVTRYLDWWSSYAAHRGHPIIADLPWKAGDPIGALLEILRQRQADVVLTWCDGRTAARLIRGLRDDGQNLLFVGGPDIVRPDFADWVGVDPGPVLALMPHDGASHRFDLSTLAADYAQRNVVGRVERPPGESAFISRDAAEHLLDAINGAGLDRNSVRYALDAKARSAFGESHFERLHAAAPITLAQWEGGRWVISEHRAQAR